MVTLKEILKELNKIKETNKKITYLKEILKKIKDKELKKKIEELIEELQKTLEQRLEGVEIRRPREIKIEEFTPKQDYKKTTTEETTVQVRQKEEEKTVGYGSSPGQYLTADERDIGGGKISPLAKKVMRLLKDEEHLIGDEIHLHPEQRRIIEEKLKEYAPNMDYETIKKYTDEISNGIEVQYQKKEKDKKEKRPFEI